VPFGLHHPSSALSIGLGISGLWNVHVQDQLRVQRKEPIVEPFTTRLNVYTVREQTNQRYTPPLQNDRQQNCITCDLWDITNPGENIKCQECVDQSARLVPATVATPSAKLTPRLRIPEKAIRLPDSPPISRCACESASCTKCSANIGLLSPVSPVTSEVKRSRAGRCSKLSAAALNRLQSWLNANRDHPYPTAEAKATLAQECGITVKQVCTWFTNTRARHLKASDEHEEDHAFDGSTPGTSSLYSNENANDQLVNTPHRSPNVEGGHTQPQSSRRGRKKDYRRNNATSPAAVVSPVQPSRRRSNAGTSEATNWQCTFCRQSLAPKSWRRHEETQHRPKHIWICLASGPTVMPRSNSHSLPVCAFCPLQNPQHDHCNNAHRMLECVQKTEDERTFLRPDHLRQHVKNFHKTSLSEDVRNLWRRDGPGKNTNEGWLCGFCNEDLQTWDMRETHIAGHFKEGLTMADWKAPPTESPSAIEPAAAIIPPLSEFDFGPLTDVTGSFAWDLGVDNGSNLSFGNPFVPNPNMQIPVSDDTYCGFQEQGHIETNFGPWQGNTMDYHGIW
jgi:hypothetical protein